MPAILLVDDDMNLLQGLRRALHSQPYDLFIATSAEMAMEMFQRRPFDLVVMDQQMSRVTGSQLATWINDNFPDVVRIMLTGHANVWVAQEAINRGGVHKFLVKPIRDVDLAMEISEGLQLRIKQAETVTQEC
tara:strand:+ start:268 stop:666 length:399 start_codon:yes stop_codon:yes gene_type:complete